MVDSSRTAPESRPPLSGRGLGRRRLLAIGAAAPVALAIAKSSGTLTAPGTFTTPGTPLLADAANRTADSYSGTASYFC